MKDIKNKINNLKTDKSTLKSYVDAFKKINKAQELFKKRGNSRRPDRRGFQQKGKLYGNPVLKIIQILHLKLFTICKNNGKL